MFRFLISLVVFVVDVYVILQILQSNEAAKNKVVWILVVLLLPVLGVVIWFFMNGPGAGNLLKR